jgi:O-acetyl-ADP-ribose deacetylase (regulator of RNase III)
MKMAVLGGVSMSEQPTLRSRTWNLLHTARAAGLTGVAVATAANVFGVSPEAVLGAMLPEMTEGMEPPVYCKPGGAEGPILTPRRYPEGVL